MDARPLGATGILVPPVGLGTVKLGRNTDVKYPEAFALPDDAAVDRLLEAAFEMGVRLLDTAPAYGRSEERLAPFVARRREDLVLCTKAGEDYGPEGSSFDFSGVHLRRSLERSLRRLGTDRVEILLLHSDGRDLEHLQRGDAVATLLQLREEGKARCVGISAKTAEGLHAAAAAGLDVVMAPYSLEDPSRGEALRRVRERGVGTLGIKALGSGHLARRDGATPALAHALSAPFLDAVVVGTLHPSHLAQAVRAAEAAPAQD